MKAYRVVEGGPEWMPKYRATQSDAKSVAANDVPRVYRDGLRIELVGFDTPDKLMVCQMLNGGLPHMKVERTWAMTPGGGLKEVENGE